MSKLVTKEVFFTIFKNKNYRYKLDKIILNFFGLDTINEINEKKNAIESVTLKFVVMLNTEILLNIIVKDTKNLFQNSKIFYINLSYREVEKYHELLIPCYWEIYIPYSFQYLKKDPKLVLFSALFYCENKDEIKEILGMLKTFTKKEIKEILKRIP